MTRLGVLVCVYDGDLCCCVSRSLSLSSTLFFFLMIRRPPRSTLDRSSAASDVYKRQVSHEVEGPHAQVGAEIAKRYGVPPKAVNCIAAHHHEVDAENLETIIVATADAISGARPGARREALETYVKRLTALEDIANSFGGVSESFAIQAGREIRVVVRPDATDDMAAIKLSRDIAKKVEDNLEYPGQIKITVIREMRAIDYAK